MKSQNVAVLSRSECSRKSSGGTRPFFVQRLWKHKMKTTCFFHLLFAVLLFAVVWIALSGHTLAYYTSSRTGNDISYPQCGTSNLPQNAFGIVGITGGRAFTGNPCLSKEFAWASNLPNPPSVYMNLNAPIGPTASEGMSGPYGNCAKEDGLCQAKNYGYNAAQYAFSYAADQDVLSPMWWLDIEVANSWSSDTSLNQRTIDGAVRFFAEQEEIAVGIYSTPSMWSSITENYRNHLPAWFPAGSMPPETYCSSKYSFTGGPVYLVQYISNGFDTNYAC